MTMNQTSEYDADVEHVGYGKPPKRTQFKKGRNGNPKGRRKGSGMRSAVEKVLARKVAVTVDGVREKVSITEAVMTQLGQRALAQDPVATRDFLKIAGQVTQAAAEEDEKHKPFAVTIKQFTYPDDCVDALKMLEAVMPVGDGYVRLKIQPWVIAAALAQGVHIGQADRELIAKVTVQPGDVRARDKEV